MDNPIIQLKDVCFSYGQEEVLRDITLDIAPGSFLPCVGPNGAGKTTLLRLILGLLKPTSGTVRTPFAVRPPGYVTQLKTIDPIYPVTARQIVTMGLYPELGPWRRPTAEQKTRVEDLLERFARSAHAKKTYGELSGGMKQKTILARALVSRPEVIIMDEPTSELDEKSEMEFLNHLVNLNRHDGMTVLLAHHGRDQAAALAERLCVVDHGRVSVEPGRGLARAPGRHGSAGAQEAVP